MTPTGPSPAGAGGPTRMGHGPPCAGRWQSMGGRAMSPDEGAISEELLAVVAIVGQSEAERWEDVN